MRVKKRVSHENESEINILQQLHYFILPKTSQQSLMFPYDWLLSNLAWKQQLWSWLPSSLFLHAQFEQAVCAGYVAAINTTYNHTVDPNVLATATAADVPLQFSTYTYSYFGSNFAWFHNIYRLGIWPCISGWDCCPELPTDHPLIHHHQRPNNRDSETHLQFWVSSDWQTQAASQGSNEACTVSQSLFSAELIQQWQLKKDQRDVC